MADMSALTDQTRSTLLFAGMPIAALALAGLALGAFFWLWTEHGAEVYLNYLAGVAITCC
jgi:hypothetical protein